MICAAPHNAAGSILVSIEPCVACGGRLRGAVILVDQRESTAAKSTYAAAPMTALGKRTLVLLMGGRQCPRPPSPSRESK